MQWGKHWSYTYDRRGQRVVKIKTHALPRLQQTSLENNDSKYNYQGHDRDQLKVNVEQTDKRQVQETERMISNMPETCNFENMEGGYIRMTGQEDGRIADYTWRGQELFEVRRTFPDKGVSYIRTGLGENDWKIDEV